MTTPGQERTPNTMLINLKDTIPDPAERERLNKRLLTHGEETGWWDERGVPAPWPDDIDTWPAPILDTDTLMTSADASGNPPF